MNKRKGTSYAVLCDTPRGLTTCFHIDISRSRIHACMFLSSFNWSRKFWPRSGPRIVRLNVTFVTFRLTRLCRNLVQVFRKHTYLVPLSFSLGCRSLPQSHSQHLTIHDFATVLDLLPVEEYTTYVYELKRFCCVRRKIAYSNCRVGRRETFGLRVNYERDGN